MNKIQRDYIKLMVALSKFKEYQPQFAKKIEKSVDELMEAIE